MSNAPDIEFCDDALQVRLRGLPMAGSLRRRVDIPYRSIQEIEVGPLPAGRPTLWRLGGLAAGGRLFGTFRRDGRWLFLAVHRRDRVVHLRLDGTGPERVRFAEVVVSSDDPDALAAALRERIGLGAPAARSGKAIA